ncbi:MAG: cupin domain-containing protein [Deinococcales bacterium]
MSAGATSGARYERIERASGGELPEAGVLSRTLARGAGVRLTWFGFAAGEELTEHTSTRPALLHVLRGRAGLTLGEDAVEVGAGDLVRMEAGLRHSVRALEPLELVLTLLPADGTTGGAA